MELLNRGRMTAFHVALAGAATLALSACAQPAAPEAPETETSASEPAWLQADFEPPILIEAEGFKLVPLGPDLVDIDYEAYMSSIEHLQTTFTRSTGWPRQGITAEEAMTDMENEEGRFERRESFAYAVLTPDGTRERGCVYVRPNSIEGYDAEVRLWVTKAEFDAGFDEELYAWTQSWIEGEWPFASVAYPGRAIAWEEWDALVEAAKEDEAIPDEVGA